MLVDVFVVEEGDLNDGHVQWIVFGVESQSEVALARSCYGNDEGMHTRDEPHSNAMIKPTLYFLHPHPNVT